jgi:glycerol kinase
MTNLVLALDQGTTGSQAALFNAESLEIVSHRKVEFPQYYPAPGWVEHDLNEIWTSTLQALKGALDLAEKRYPNPTKRIAAIGITNQRETIAAWNKKTGELGGRAVVWQDRRTADACTTLRQDATIRDRIETATGLLLDPYFSATKIAWLLKNNSKVKSWAASGELALGTIDSFLINRLSNHQSHVTDHTNASRTMLYGLTKGDYEDGLLDLFGIRREFLPEIRPSVGLLATTSKHPLLPDGIPIMGCLGDQQAALFGHRCTARGEGKITFGTGSFLLSPIGEAPVKPRGGLLCSVAMSSAQARTFALEGSVFVAASSLQYLRDKFGWMGDAAESEALAQSDIRDPEVQVIPSFTGFGAPFWNPRAKAAIVGLSLGTSKAQIIRATLEAIALQNVALVKIMEQDAGTPISRLGVDGGASNNNFLMQFQADVLKATITRPVHSELTSLGAARAALRGLGAPGAEAAPQASRVFAPQMNGEEADAIVSSWQRAAGAINAFYS